MKVSPMWRVIYITKYRKLIGSFIRPITLNTRKKQNSNRKRFYSIPHLKPFLRANRPIPLSSIFLERDFDQKQYNSHPANSQNAIQVNEIAD